MTVKESILIKCADEKIRHCYSVIADFMIDYKKQMLITEIKMNQHCTICQVSLNECRNLEGN